MKKLSALLCFLLFCGEKTKEVGRAEFSKEFPKDFLWGVAFSDFQAGMGGGKSLEEQKADTKSDWWVWIRDEKNKEKKYIVPPYNVPEESSGFLNFYKDDIKRAKELNINSIRFSILWSRLFPNSTTEISVKVERTEDGKIKNVEIDGKIIEKMEELVDKNSVALYREIFKNMVENGIKPFISLLHFALPIWIHDPIKCRDYFEKEDFKGEETCFGAPSGLLSETFIIEFAKFSAYMAWKFGDLVDLWTTIVEPMVPSIGGYILGGLSALAGAGSFPPAGVFRQKAFYKSIENQIYAHAIAYNQIKKWDKYDADNDGKNSIVGVAYNVMYVEPENPEDEKDLKAVDKAKEILNWIYLDGIIKGIWKGCIPLIECKEPKVREEIKGKIDILGVNYYSRTKIKYFSGPGDFIFITPYPACQKKEECPYGQNDSGLEIYPPGIRLLLKEVWERYKDDGIKIIVTENGTSDATDSHRPWHIVSHLYYIQKAIEDKIPILGYYHWSLMDNLEWTLGFSKRFGLFEVDFSNPEKPRKKRNSADIYSKIISENKIPQNLSHLIK